MMCVSNLLGVASRMRTFLTLDTLSPKSIQRSRARAVEVNADQCGCKLWMAGSRASMSAFKVQAGCQTCCLELLLVPHLDCNNWQDTKTAYSINKRDFASDNM